MNCYEEKIKNIIDRYNSFFISKKNIIAVGLGNKEIDGHSLDIPCLKIYVENKIQKPLLDSQSLIPQKFYGVLTDIVECNEHPENEGYLKNTIGDIVGKFIKPARGGDLIRNGDEEYEGGTLGYVVYKKVDTSTERKCILSSGRVVSGNFLGSKSSSIYHVKEIPKTQVKNKYDINDKLGIVTDFSDVKFIKDSEINSKEPPKDVNMVDAGIVMSTAITLNNLGNGLIDDNKKVSGSFTDIKAGNKVLIINRQSSVKEGTVTATNGYAYLMYDSKLAYFGGQILVKMKTSRADYGSVGLIEMKDGTYKIFGLLIGNNIPSGNKKTPVTNTISVFTPISRVLAEMKVFLLEDKE